MNGREDGGELGAVREYKARKARTQRRWIGRWAEGCGGSGFVVVVLWWYRAGIILLAVERSGSAV